MLSDTGSQKHKLWLTLQLYNSKTMKNLLDIGLGFICGMEYLGKVWNSNFLKVMNSMKFGIAVWKSMDFFEFHGDFFGQYIFHSI